MVSFAESRSNYPGHKTAGCFQLLLPSHMCGELRVLSLEGGDSEESRGVSAPREQWSVCVQALVLPKSPTYNLLCVRSGIASLSVDV